MAIIVQCPCGKRMGVSDALAGRDIRCPQCGAAVYVDSASKAAPRSPARKQREPLHISPAMLNLIAVFFIAVIAACVIRWGPLRVHRQWEAMGPKAEGEVEDVVSFAIQAYLSQQQLYNPRKPLGRPSVDGGVNFIVPWMVLTMPERLRFFGMTQQGRFAGFYDTATGEIEADIAYGGRTVGGLVVAQRATAIFHITGRDLGGFPQAEVDGTPLKIVYPPPEAP